MEAAVDSLAEGGEVDSEGASVGRGTRATSVEGRDTGPSTARDQVTKPGAHKEKRNVVPLLMPSNGNTLNQNLKAGLMVAFIL